MKGFFCYLILKKMSNNTTNRLCKRFLLSGGNHPRKCFPMSMMVSRRTFSQVLHSNSSTNNTNLEKEDNSDDSFDFPILTPTKIGEEKSQIEGLIKSMNILEFSDDSDLEECNRIISSLIDSSSTYLEGQSLVVACNALLKRSFIEIYFTREYEKAKEDVVMVRRLLGERIDEETNRLLSKLN